MTKKAKTKTARKPRPKRPKPTYFDGMAPPSIKAIDDAAEEYVDARDERMDLLKTEIARHDILLERMKENGLSSYEFDGFKVELLSKTKVKVRRAKVEGDEENGEAEE